MFYAYTKEYKHTFTIPIQNKPLKYVQNKTS